MTVSIILPSIDLVTDPENDVDVNGANVALWIQLKTYANHPAFSELELFLAPRDISNPAAIQRFAQLLLAPENRGKGRLAIHSIYSLGDVWADGRERILHTDDLWALMRDRRLRDQYARGKMIHISDTHCLGHHALHQSMHQVNRLPRRRGDTIVACSAATADAIRQSYGPNFPYAVTYCHRRIDEAGLVPGDSARKTKVRQELGLPTHLKLGVYLGRVTPAMKGDLTLLIDSLVAMEDPMVGIVIAGVSNMKGYHQLLMDYATSQGVGDRVFIFGRFAPSKRAAWYQAADVFLFPSDTINEAFGQTTLEAMACGLPVIQSAWSGMKETVKPEYGTLVSTTTAPVPERVAAMTGAVDVAPQFLCLAQATVIDRDEWYGAFRSWMTDDDRRAEGGRSARLAFEERFADPGASDRWADLLSRILAGAANAPEERRNDRQQLPWEANYDLIQEAYASLPWDDRTIFEETSRGNEWRQGREQPIIYDEMSAVLDTTLLAAIQERVANAPASAEDLAKVLSGDTITRRDVVYHAMFLAKQGFLRFKPFVSA